MKDAFGRAPARTRTHLSTGGKKVKKRELKKQVEALEKQFQDASDRAEKYADKLKGKKGKEGKKLRRKHKRAQKEVARYTAFLNPKSSKKRTKRRKARVNDLVKNEKITPASAPMVLAYAATLGRNVEKVRLKGGKKRTLEDHFLRGLEKGDGDPIYQEFALAPVAGVDEFDDDTGIETDDKELAKKLGVQIGDE